MLTGHCCPLRLQVVWIAASRIYLGLHTPVDILAGALAGLAVLVCFIAVEGGCLLIVVSAPPLVDGACCGCGTRSRSTVLLPWLVWPQ